MSLDRLQGIKQDSVQARHASLIYTRYFQIIIKKEYSSKFTTYNKFTLISLFSEIKGYSHLTLTF